MRKLAGLWLLACLQLAGGYAWADPDPGQQASPSPEPAPTQPSPLATPTAGVSGAAAGNRTHPPVNNSISANPGAVNVVIGSGLLGRVTSLDRIPGVTLGGLWIGDHNYLISGGVNPRKSAFDSLLIVNLLVDLDDFAGLKGAKFGGDFLQFYGQPAIAQAGSVQGYNSVIAAPPLQRNELYQLWFRQELFDGKLAIRVGKTVPTYDFTNVSRPAPTGDEATEIHSVTGLIYTPIFDYPPLLGAIPGYYDSAYGVTLNYAPTKQFYINYGLYDGSLARGVTTGLKVGPTFKGHYFTIAETGYAWTLGRYQQPGKFGMGGWVQTGKLYGPPGVEEDGTGGFYAYGSQRLWYHDPGIDSSGITSFLQMGVNDSSTLPANYFVGGGLTALGLVPNRPADSFGAGFSWAWLNRNLGLRSNEFMAQFYYQVHLLGPTFFQPSLTYIPNPGNNPQTTGALTITSRILFLF